MKIHLVLGAGGMKTLGYVGLLQGLCERGIEFATVSACSAGSLFGACLAAGVAPARLVDFVLQGDLEKFLGEPASSWAPAAAAMLSWPRARFKTPGLPSLFVELAGADPSFEELTLPFATIGLDLLSSRMLVYSKDTTPTMKVSEAIRIATAVPFLYPPHVTADRVVVDGAIATQCPVWLAMARPEGYPILAISPRRPLVHPRDQGIEEFLGSLVSLGGTSRDLYLLDQMARAVHLEIDAADVRYDEFDVSSEQRALLVSAGRAAAEQAHIRVQAVAHGGLEPAVYEPASADSVEMSHDSLAERGGARAMARANSAIAKQARTQIFISYAHKNQEWVPLFRDMLAPVLREHAVEVWEDSRIRAGASWRHEITTALARTKVAMLLVTPEFLASSFIDDIELAAILKAAQVDGLVVIWVLVSSCVWEKSRLEPFQCVNDTDVPLDTLTPAQRNKVISHIARQVGLALA